MLKDILVHVDASAGGEHRLAYALGLADAHGARLTGAHVIQPVDVPHYVAPSAVERVAKSREQAGRAAALAAAQLFAEASKARGTPTAWRMLEGDMAGQLAELGRCADLIIVGQYESQGVAERHPTYLAEDLVLAAGRPVLVTPEQLRGPYELRRALIGWDGGREAARAVHDALPLLLAARPQIEIVAFEEGGGRPDAATLAEHLGRHGLAASLIPKPGAPASHGAALVGELNAQDYDLLVIGAYGHPLWQELLFGGATNSVLTQAPTPVLVSH